MLFEITTYKVRGNKRVRISAMEIQARDASIAMERACINFKPDRAVEIRMKESPFEMTVQRPAVARVGRDAA